MRKVLCFLCACTIVLLYSCEDEATKLRRQMEEFAGSTIVIPERLEEVNYSGKEGVNNRDKDALLVVYVDSIACAKCAIKGMYVYDEIIEFAETDSRSKFSPVFVFSPRRYEYVDVKNTLRFSGLNTSAFMDENGLFPAANPHIPADNRFHTFLLDKNGKVVLVGDPVNNPPLWELYKSTITTLIENDGVMPDVEKKD
jgi:hypothetical protein